MARKKVKHSYELDFDKIKTVKDLTIVIKSLNPVYKWEGKDIPAVFKEVYNKKFLKEMIT